MPPCLHPLIAWRELGAPEGFPKITFQSRGRRADSPTAVKIRCGKCIACKLEFARVWADRCYHESFMHRDNCFLTLTYADKFLPEYGSLSKRHVQLFLKRLRKVLSPKTFRYFCVGEYGAESLRPHYHLILFGYIPDDLLPVGLSSSGVQQFTSPLIDKCWNMGLSTVAYFSREYCRYVAHYSLKKMTSELNLPSGFEPEFRLMSRRPGIGRGFVEKYENDLYNYDCVVYDNGARASVPRYYDSVLSVSNPARFESVRRSRLALATSPEAKEELLEQLCDFRTTLRKQEYLTEMLNSKRSRDF
ncbi:replication initiator protein [Dipodfec virus UOA04_Rod_861]|nr:replication initiator protein [Dipodfec virus UOA04_Rod_861]